jgi:hypothetical protein
LRFDRDFTYVGRSLQENYPSLIIDIDKGNKWKCKGKGKGTNVRQGKAR